MKNDGWGATSLLHCISKITLKSLQDYVEPTVTLNPDTVKSEVGHLCRQYVDPYRVFRGYRNHFML